MIARYDIFRAFPDAGPVWLETAKDLDDAKKRLLKLSSNEPGDYFVYDYEQQAIVEKLKKSA